MKKRLAYILVLFLVAATGRGDTDKKIIGALATVHIEEGGIEMVGRVDTGAKTTSINAINIKASNGFVSYTVVNALGKKARLKSKIEDELLVRNAESKEKRLFVYLTINYMGDSKRSLVNLNDRSGSSYKLLLGRNWLSGSYIVDVDK